MYSSFKSTRANYYLNTSSKRWLQVYLCFFILLTKVNFFEMQKIHIFFKSNHDSILPPTHKLLYKTWYHLLSSAGLGISSWDATSYNNYDAMSGLNINLACRGEFVVKPQVCPFILFYLVLHLLFSYYFILGLLFLKVASEHRNPLLSHFIFQKFK